MNCQRGRQLSSHASRRRISRRTQRVIVWSGLRCRTRLAGFEVWKNAGCAGQGSAAGSQFRKPTVQSRRRNMSNPCRSHACVQAGGILNRLMSRRMFGERQTRRSKTVLHARRRQANRKCERPTFERSASHNGRFLRHRPKRSERCLNYERFYQGQLTSQNGEGVPKASA